MELTKRQIKILKLLAQGKKPKEIAQKINFSQGTVRAELDAMFRVTNSNGQSMLLLWAYKNGYLS